MCTIPTTRKDGQPIIWEQAKGFSKYLISDDGRIYSVKRDKLIEPSNKNNIKGSYLVVTLYNDEGRKKYMLVHRLVYMAHKGLIPKGLQVNHKDEDKENNCIEESGTYDTKGKLQLWHKESENQPNQKAV